MTVCYKLTNQDLQTYNGYQWVVGETKRTTGDGDLCGAGWLHCYDDPLVALFLNPIHADIQSPRLWLAEGGGVMLDDRGLKRGYTEMTLVREAAPGEVPEPTAAQRVTFGVLCGLSVCKDRRWRAWAERWLSGEDRSRDAAYAAYAAAATAAAAYAATDTAYAAAYAATDTAAYAAADAAAYATAVTPLDLPMLAAWAMTFGEDAT